VPSQVTSENADFSGSFQTIDTGFPLTRPAANVTLPQIFQYISDLFQCDFVVADAFA
jgi:hypothetical protein